MHAVLAMVATAVESMAAFEHADPAFTADAPALPAAEPTLTLERPARGRLRPATRQDHATDTTVRRRLFIGRGAETAIARGEVRCAAEDRLMSIQRHRPQGDIGRSLRVPVVARNDLMFRFLNGDQFAELVGFRDLAFANGLGVRFEDAQHFVGDVGIAAQDARPRLVDDTLHERPHRLQLMLCALQDRLNLWTRGAPPLAQSTDHRRRVPQYGARGRHQLLIALHQGGPRFGRSGLVANDQHAPSDAPQPIANPPQLIAQRRTRALHRAREHAHPVLQQGTVGWIVHIRFYDRGVDAKAAAVRHTLSLRDLHHLTIRLLDGCRA